jgi:hypothetical protein
VRQPTFIDSPRATDGQDNSLLHRVEHIRVMQASRFFLFDSQLKHSSAAAAGLVSLRDVTSYGPASRQTEKPQQLPGGTPATIAETSAIVEPSGSGHPASAT